MSMTKQERRAFNKKQERLQIKSGVPTLNELKEGIPVLRKTSEGLVEYVRQNRVLYKKVLNKV